MEENNHFFEERPVELVPKPLPKEGKFFTNFLIFMAGILALSIFTPLTIEVIKLIGLDRFTEVSYMATVNFFTYFLTFSTLGLLLYFLHVIEPLIRDFKKLRTYLYGLFYGLVVIIGSITVSLLMNLIFGDQGSNANQGTIELIIKNHPLSSFFWIVLAGPIVEEIIYRFGLFGGLRKINRPLAYVVSALIFGFIHFNVPVDENGAVIMAELITELINIPSYIVSGLIFAYAYDKEGFGVGVVAHITNNLISFIFSIISIIYGTN